MTYLLIIVYAAAIISANLLVAHFGPSVTAINAFFLIGLDLSLRNLLSIRMSSLQMGLLIIGTGILSYVINPASGMIAIASGVAFTAASLADWATFNTTSGKWMKRNLAGNTVGAAIDSLLFPTIAFGSLMPVVVVVQFAAKVAGGSVWGYLINKRLVK